MNKTSALKRATIRTKILSIRNNLPKVLVQEKSLFIKKRILLIDKIKKPKNILAYISINNEVDTRSIIDELAKESKKNFLPKFFNKKWVVCQFTSWSNLENGPYQTLQPKQNKIIDIDSIDIALIPAVAFGRNGVRLGFGKGVYDKLLENFNGLKIGLAYDFQIIDLLPKEKHDLVMDLIVTDKSILDFRTI